jgi:hypothetical protein
MWWLAMHRRLGELYDKQGNAAKATEHYEWFVRGLDNLAPRLGSSTPRALHRPPTAVA